MGRKFLFIYKHDILDSYSNTSQPFKQCQFKIFLKNATTSSKICKTFSFLTDLWADGDIMFLLLLQTSNNHKQKTVQHSCLLSNRAITIDCFAEILTWSLFSVKNTPILKSQLRQNQKFSLVEIVRNWHFASSEIVFGQMFYLVRNLPLFWRILTLLKRPTY